MLQLVATPEQVRYTGTDLAEDKRSDFPLALLQAALQASDGQYQLVKSADSLKQSRALKLLAENQHIDVVWSMTSVEREQDLMPIRVPIFMGLEGARVMLIHQQQQSRFTERLADGLLRRLLIGQGHDWVDADILEENGFTVMRSASYPVLFNVLEQQRIDGFARNVIEVSAEARDVAKRNIVIEKAWLLYYPTANYYFVSKDNAKLGRAIEQGLMRMLQSGAMQQMLADYYAEDLAALALEQRQLVRLHNRLLPPDTPLGNTLLWHPLVRQWLKQPSAQTAME
ncbi:hypothetical protein [Arsukibacterium sp.]|uniref:hypothetical protein n=1 Tax=Arsukibacterium sp. TaxID=1977258 RepID=UPI002FD8B72E